MAQRLSFHVEASTESVYIVSLSLICTEHLLTFKSVCFIIPHQNCYNGVETVLFVVEINVCRVVTAAVALVCAQELTRCL